MEHNSKALSKSAQSVQKALAEKGLPLTVIELAASTRTAQDAASALKCEVGQIVKSLIFRTKKTNRPILILASGPNRVDEKLIEQAVGEEITKADADFTREATGFAIGGIPPVGHKQHLETYIDEDLLNFDQVWAAAGTPHAVFSVPSQELAALTHGKIIKIYTKK
jgi:prolyl-tRNA editing enzyme YbaK/EbsC (Cys-tRNA(Pro) deacylase)